VKLWQFASGFGWGRKLKDLGIEFMNQMRMEPHDPSDVPTHTLPTLVASNPSPPEFFGGRQGARGSRLALFLVVKRLFDVVLSLLLLPLLLLMITILVCVNPWLNPRPLFFVQIRMGRERRAFAMIKFRSMRRARARRGADDHLELDRITPFGGMLRKSRLDELPQILNVLRGDMSLIGPRPDDFSHARVFCRQVPGYRERHALRPGISGLAQVEHGYAEGVDATREKARLDVLYIENLGLRQECYVFVKTIGTILASVGK
jgi:lipopolysaccharide/colanic/teichoic acid biosynthesis glycosyltransferase